MRAVAERLRADGLRVWFDEWVIKPGDSIPRKIEEGLEHSRVLVFCMSANAFGSDWAQLESGTYRFLDPLNKGRGFIPLRLDDAPIKGSLAQFLYINWRPAADREREYAKLLDACRNPANWSPDPKLKPKALSARTANPATRRQLLERVQKDQVESRLGQGLREAIRVDMHLKETVLPLKMYVFSDESVMPRTRETTEPIQNIFAKSSPGSLAILGQPGTGKTNLLLELAGSLIAEAEQNPELPIPIVFSLARWTLTERDRPLDEWMIDELKGYDVGAKVAEDLVHQEGLLPLLDGLDEVAADRREACVMAICNYQNSPSAKRRVVLCCRLEEYEHLSSKPDIKTEIRVELLTSDDVDREITKPGLEHVQQAIAADPALRSIIRTPLWLHVLYLAAHVEPIHKALDPLDRLFDQYVRYALRRHPKGLPRNRTDSNQLLHWLGCLASEMRRRDQSQFAIDDLNFSWFVSRWPERPPASQGVRDGGTLSNAPEPTNSSAAIRVAQRSAFGSIVGLTGWLVGGGIFGLVVGLIPIVRVEGRIEASEDLRFEWRGALSRVWFSLGYGLLLGLTFGATYGWVGGLCLGLCTAIFEAFQGGFQPKPVSSINAPNLKTRRSLYHAGLIATVGMGLAALLIIVSKIGSSFRFTSAELEGVFMRVAVLIVLGGVILGGEKGGWFAARHYAARFMLWRRGYAPWAYVKFLNESVERLFLIRRGGSYEFLHITFRDYMAKTHGPDTPCATQDVPDRIKAGQVSCIA